MTARTYPIIAVITTRNTLAASIKNDSSYLKSLVVIGRPSLGLVVSEHIIIV